MANQTEVAGLLATGEARRITVDLTQDTVQALSHLSKMTGVSHTDCINKAIQAFSQIQHDKDKEYGLKVYKAVPVEIKGLFFKRREVRYRRIIWQ